MINPNDYKYDCYFYEAADAIMVAVAIDRHCEFDESQQKPLS